MLDSAEGAAGSATEASRLAPHLLQNWASDGLSRPQLGQSMVKLPFPGEQLIGVMILLAGGRDKS